MPDTRHHRGPDPRDAEAFAPDAVPVLRSAVDDLCWLLSRGYADRSALKIVGDRYALTERQRNAVRRCSCGDGDRDRRLRHCVSLESLRGQPLAIDGFNVLMTIESALGGAVVLAARDGSYRDLASVHGTYRNVEETRPALELIGQHLADYEVGPCRWYLDSPVSNSGRLKGVILDIARQRDYSWEVELVFNPDPILIASADAVATSDSGILGGCGAWVALSRHVVERSIVDALVVDLSLNNIPPRTGGPPR